MKIAMISSHFYPYVGGIENHVANLATQLSKMGHDIEIFTSNDPKGPSEEEFSRNILIHRLFQVSNTLNNPILPFLPLKILSRSDFDIIHAHDHYFFGSNVAVIFRCFHRIPFVITIHTTSIQFGGIGDLIKPFYEKTLGKKVLQKSDKTIVLTNSLKKVFSFLLENRKIVVIPNGVDAVKFNPKIKGTTFREKYRLPDSDFNLLFVGRLVKRKGIQYLLKALPYVLKEIPSVKLTIVGSGPVRADLEELARREKLTNNVVFTGPISDAILPEAYGACDIFVLPSISGDAFPITLLEAMATGKPVIATPVGGIPEILENGRLGNLTEPKDPISLAKNIVELLNNKELRRKWGDKCREVVVKNYDWTAISQKTYLLYMAAAFEMRD